MKNNLLLLFTGILISAFVANAQPYTFTQYTSTYADLPSPTVISTPFWDDFTVLTLPLPFTFNYFGTNFNTIYCMGGFDGFVYNGTGSGGTFGSFEIYSYDNAMTDFNGTATISYLVTGSSPNRILKIQTLNANFDNDDDALDYANVQLWLYEGSNIVEMHYGPYSIINSATWPITTCPGPLVTIIKDASSFVSLSGNAANPTASSSAASLCVTGPPPNGKVYKFAPNGAGGINDLNNNIAISLFPNPNKGTFTVSSGFYSGSKVDISIKNYLGETVYNKTTILQGFGATLDTDLEAGIYIMHIGNEQSNSTRKIVIQ